MNYGYLDESGDVSSGDGATGNLVVVVVVVSHPVNLRKAVSKTRKSLGKRLRDIPELKAADSDPRIIRKLLTHAVNIGFEGVAIVLDKRRIPLPEDMEDLYREACAQATRETLERFGSLSLTVDKRYTALRQQRRFNEALDACVEGMSGVSLVVHHEDSEKERTLQVADAVAWALFQWRENGDRTFWEIIRERVIVVGI